MRLRGTLLLVLICASVATVGAWTDKPHVDVAQGSRAAVPATKPWNALVEISRHEPTPRVDLAAELVVEVRWWTPDELEATTETLVPERLPELLRDLREDGPPAEAFDAGV